MSDLPPGIEPDPTEPVAAPAALALRERLLAALLADRSNVLLHHDPVLAVVRTSGGEGIALLSHDTLDALGQRADALIKGTKTGALHVVAVGADRDADPVLKARRKLLGLGFGFHRLGLDGSLHRITGLASKALKRAAASVGSTAALDDQALTEAAHRGIAAGREEAGLAAALSRSFPVVTTVLGAVCVVLFGLGWYWGEGDVALVSWHMGSNSGAAVADGEIWRLFASAFLHGGLAHLAANMVALASFGPMLESLLGRSRYLALYALCALGGAVASATLGQHSSVGASGAIWGLMTAGIGLALRPRGLLPPMVIARARQRLMVPLVLNVVISFSVPGIDIYAHFGGGAVGLILMLTGIVTHGVTPGWTDAGTALPATRTPALWTAVASLLALTMAASIGAALVTGKPWQLRQALEFRRVIAGNTGVSLELPAPLTTAPDEKTEDSVEVVTFGLLPRSPVMIELRVATLSGVATDAEVDALLGKAVTDLTASPPAGTELDRAAAIQTLGDRRFVHAGFRLPNGVPLRVWYTIMGDREVVVTAVAMPERPSAWDGVETRIIGSLQRISP